MHTPYRLRRLALTLLLLAGACSQPPPAPDLPEPGEVSPRRPQ